MNSQDLIAFFDTSYGTEPWPQPFHILQGLQKVKAGESVREAARAVGTTQGLIKAAEKSAEPAFDILAVRPNDLTDEDLQKAAKILGGLVLGQAAEAAFEDIYREEMGEDVDFQLVDLREGRTDTDYRVLNGRGRQIYRLNIKFFGSIFRRGAELVGLEPEDCFPLATYKILSALEKQNNEHLPFVFTVVGVPDLTALSLQEHFAPDDIRIIALISKSRRVSGKRSFEEKIVKRLVDEGSKAYTEAYGRIRSAEWYVLSARKAHDMLRTMFIERVYALRVRNFAQAFKRAEVDMHFSLKNDLANLRELFRILKEEGPMKTASLLERGTL